MIYVSVKIGRGVSEGVSSTFSSDSDRVNLSISSPQLNKARRSC